MSEDWVWPAEAEGTESAGAVWEAPPAEGVHRSGAGAGAFAPVGASGWSPEESSPRGGCAVGVGGAP